MIDDKTFEAWKKGLKKKMDVGLPSSVDFGDVFGTPVIRPPIKVQAPVAHHSQVFAVEFPKVAGYNVSPEFFDNAMREVSRFRQRYLPIEAISPNGVEITIDTLLVDGSSGYPIVSLVADLKAPRGTKQLEDFLRPFHLSNTYSFYWKGSFLKDKVTKQITGIKLVNIGYAFAEITEESRQKMIGMPKHREILLV